jgi:hypothetical protein
LWPIDEFATCLCAEHNNHKKDKFPVDFYSVQQLERLSEITGLSLAELQEKAVCEAQLQRIRSDISKFASNCDPRAFNAIARKVRELRADIDLWQELNITDPDIFASVKAAADERPEAVYVSKADIGIDELLDSLEN